MVEEKKTDTFEQKLIRAHSKFLESIKDVYPLAVLGSLCIAISAFTKDAYPQAQVYAIVAASLFLIAFVSSFIQKAMPSDWPAFFSMTSTAIATFFLFLVVIEFAKAISLVGKAALIVLFLFVMTIMFYLSISVLRVVQKTKSTLIVICGTITIGAVSLLLVLSAISWLSELAGISVFPKLNNNFFGAVALIVSIFLFATLLLLVKESKKKKTKTSMISGSP